MTIALKAIKRQCAFKSDPFLAFDIPALVAWIEQTISPLQELIAVYEDEGNCLKVSGPDPGNEELAKCCPCCVAARLLKEIGE